MKSRRILSQAIYGFLLFVFPFLLGSSNLIQEENETFYLSNYTSYSPGSSVTINLYNYSNYDNTQYKFKLLRIADPMNFFTGIDRSLLRGSFDIWAKDKESLLKYTELIREWNDRVESPEKFGYRNNVSIGKIDKAGIYIVQASRKGQVAYCCIVISDLAMVYKNSSKQVIAFVANSKTSKFLDGVKFNLYSQNKLAESKFGDKDGLAIFDIKDPEKFNNENALLIAQTGDETVVSDPYFYFQNGRNYFTAYIYTNQPVYRPGQEVFFKAIFREKNGNEIKNVPGQEFTVSVKSPKNKEVYSGSLTTNDMGSFSASFKLEDEADLGYYSIVISQGGNNYYGSFSVEEYKKPEYFVTVKTDKEQYSGKDVIKGTVTADYYFGSPVINGKVTVNVFKYVYWRPWWYWSEYSWFYRSFASEKMMYRPQNQLIHQVSGEFDADGKFEFEYEVEKDVEYDYTYSISAEVTDYSRRAISGSKDVFVTRGSFTLSTSTDKYFYEKGSEVNIKVNASDFSDKPVQTKFKVAVGYPDADYKNWRTKHTLYDTLYGSTDASGRGVVSFHSRYNYSGSYGYTVIAHDEKGREITASSSFFMGDKNDYWYYRDNSGLEIITDKDSYDKGDSLIAYIFLPSENTDLLLTYETDNILSYKKYSVKEKSFTIREKLKDEYSPSFNISITFVKDGQFYTTSKLIGVLAKDKFLDISINRNKKEYKPGDLAEYELLVKDYKGRPVKNTELSLGIIDESIYAIKEDDSQPIQTFFYAPAYSYIPVFCSLQRYSYNGSSRKITYADKDLTSDVKEGEESLQGKVQYKSNESAAPGVYVIVTNDKGYYKGLTDSLGNYKINKIVSGTYNIFVSTGDASFILIDSLYIDGNKKFDIKIDENVVENDVSTRSGRQNLGGDVREMKMMDAAAPMSEAVSFNSGVALQKSGGYVQAEVRSNFVDAAIWKAQVLTDENGKAKVRFKMPDNLTTWRATVKGITVGTDVGQTTDKVITRKNLLVRMETPRFFREGDKLTISTIVHNYLSEKKKAKISFNPGNLKLVKADINTPGYSTIMFDEAKGMYELNIEKNSEVRIDWTVEVNFPIGEATLKAEALTNEESDAMELKVPVLPKGYKEITTFTSSFTDVNKEEAVKFNIPSDVDLRTASLSFNVAPSLAGTVLKALDDLVDYPYGCVEQTMSRFLPAIIAANTFKEINAPLKSSTIDKLPDVVSAGLKRLYSFQHDDGGWGWWEHDQTNPYMTAYVIYGMTLAKEAGYKIDEDIYQRGIRSLKEQVKDVKDKELTTRAYMLYSISSAGKNSNSDNSEYVSDIKILVNKKLDSYSLALLVITAENFGDHSLAQKIAAKLVTQADEEKDFAFWGGKQFHYTWQDDNVQGTAFAVKALIRMNSNTELVNKAVRWLLLQKQGFSWRSTQETATVIFALTDYLKITHELDPDFNIQVYLNNEKVLDKKFTRDDIFKETGTVKLSGLTSKLLKNGENILTIKKNGSGKVYFSGLNEYYTQDKTTASKDDKFRIKREYYVLKPVQRDDHIVYVKERFTGTVKSGQDLLVKTSVDSRSGINDMQYFILEDMLPSGFEVVKDEQNYFIEGENDYNNHYPYPGIYRWRWFYADKEYRDEKTAFFVTYVNPSMQFSYIIKAQIPGSYTVMPVSGYLMYFPEVNGSSGMVSVDVVE